ncbi:MAG: succinate--CoA ligase subunit alpha [Actinobacteria bacterium]|nr:succinate--CoA ligase subunit alpha [Actinomycetota bacterium]
MSILVDENTRVVVQGLTGEQGRFHAGRMAAYGTHVVAGVTPGKGGTQVDGVDVYDSVLEAVDEAGANTAVVFVPAARAADAILESVDASVGLVVCITEGIAVHEMSRVYAHLACSGRETTLVGPNCPGIISPGKATVGIIPGDIASPGSVGLVSRSGTLTYEIMDELSRKGIGQSTTVGIGGDPIVGSSFIDCLRLFEADPQTETVLLIGEIGGEDEELAAQFVRDEMETPVAAYIAGFTAPPGKRMGHAGAIVSGSSGTAAAKAEALEAAGVKVARSPARAAELVSELVD